MITLRSSRSEKFLHQGNKLKITLMFRGREMEHIDLGMNLVKQAIEDLGGVGSQTMNQN